MVVMKRITQVWLKEWLVYEIKRHYSLCFCFTYNRCLLVLLHFYVVFLTQTYEENLLFLRCIVSYKTLPLSMCSICRKQIKVLEVSFVSMTLRALLHDDALTLPCFERAITVIKTLDIPNLHILLY